MKKVVTSGVAAALLAMNVACAFAQTDEYKLGPGDVVRVGVWGYDDLKNEELVIRPDGRLSFPLAGELNVQGMTTGELTAALTTRLGKYVLDPNVTINIAKFRTTRVYVLGEVTKPGMYELEKQHNLLDAIGMAGSYTKRAAKKEVFIIRKENVDKPQKVNLLKLLKNGDVSQNVVLNEGDVVYLTSNGKITFATDVLPWISAIYQVDRLGNED
ncbi:polysaccharide biosynthesis/export family protein [Anaerospora hongkongensis]|uniref:polysaccharide biosynthesis/export family protein n=1 Tax=Anaerospora hongkongensis TaxID=244830 RepID=UPI00289B921C|nr:polysaccharide biosynthesis/export family protein [Anaerospora hongkongensis]